MQDARVVADKYRLIAKLSDGFMGSVWSAEHVELKCPAAVKLLEPSFTDSPEALSRFKREAQSAASLRSTNIVQILDFGLDNGVPYIAMELLRGRTLAALLAEAHQLSPRETALILSQVARAVAWAHDMDIIHRDLKPGNIFLSEDAGETLVKLLDFGIAKPLTLNPNEDPVTMTGSIVGTPQYMSPEQASGRRPVDHRTDIWSFGIVAYECMTGQRAFAADSLGSLVLAICSDPLPVPSDTGPVPTGFDEWFARCAHRDPGRRFLSIDEASDVLRFVCGLEVSSSFSIPQLYSYPPPSPVTRGSAASSNGRPAYSTVGTSTDAPSIITLSSSLERRPGFQKLALFVGLFVTGGVLALLLRSGHTSAQRSVTAAPVPTVLSSHQFAPTPVNLNPQSLPASDEQAAPRQLDATNTKSAPIEAVPGKAAVAKVKRGSRSVDSATKSTADQKPLVKLPAATTAPSVMVDPPAPPHGSEARFSPPTAGSSGAPSQVEVEIGLTRVTASRSSQ